MNLKEILNILEGADLENKLKKWKYKQSADYAKKISGEYGPPDEVTSNTVIWNKLDGLGKTLVKDEKIPHDWPVKHIDYVYSTKKIQVPEDKVPILKKASKSIIIDALKNEVTARCHFLIKNAVTLGFAEDVAKGKIKEEDARDEYARRIKNDIIPAWYKDRLREKGGAKSEEDIEHHLK